MSVGSQERWDILLRFLDGPLAMQGEMVLRGPVVRMGANPGPGELKLDGYRGLDERQAVITAYDSGTASIAPVGKNQVRLAPHEHVSWGEVQPLRGPAHLTPGCAIHVGPPGRGASFVFVDCRRLGVWEQRSILSEAQIAPESTEVREVDASAGIPRWFLPGLFTMGGGFATALGLLLFYFALRDRFEIGPTYEGSEQQDLDTLADKSQIDARVYERIDDAFGAFVMKPNAEAAGDTTILARKDLWDKALTGEIGIYESQMAHQWSVWSMFDRAVGPYSDVLAAVRAAGLPDALAAIPFQESAYRPEPTSPVCAKGWWQFMPETARRAGLEVASCHFRGKSEPWSPSLMAPPMNAYKNADYVAYDPVRDVGECRITSCDRDQRTDLAYATRGAVKLLLEAWADPEIAQSGSAVQLVIGSHNAGYDDARYRDGQVSQTQIRPALQKWKKDKNLTRDLSFWGSNMTCRKAAEAHEAPVGKSCGGLLQKETQNYVPLILAYQFLAACYYGKNYDQSYPNLKSYNEFLVGNGYCSSLHVPSREEVDAHVHGGGQK